MLNFSSWEDVEDDDACTGYINRSIQTFSDKVQMVDRKGIASFNETTLLEMQKSVLESNKEKLKLLIQ